AVTSSTSDSTATSSTSSSTTSPSVATTGGGDGDTGRTDSQTSETSVAAGLEGNTAQSLQQLPLTGVELETAFLAIVAVMFGVVLLRRARSWQSRLDRRAARVWRRPIS
ncbi:MAG: hypothetical protein OER12_03505, partial [Acidimicrobiia bacterium]|nr:hypothetical protein [Acidimicrobiia bacterium]